MGRIESAVVCSLAGSLLAFLASIAAPADELPAGDIPVPTSDIQVRTGDVAAPTDGVRRPTIGLVLSGGGARGAAHVGVIEVLEELRIPVDYIAGTSMGAVVGGLYASGLSSAALSHLLAELDWVDLFDDRTRRRDRSPRRKRDDLTFLSNLQLGLKDWRIRLPTGFIKGQKLEQELSMLALPVSKVRDFDRLSIPFRAVASDIETGEAAVLGSGNLATAIRASMSIPAVFDAVPVGDRLLVDGGTAMNLPVQVAQEMGADIIIAVDIASPLRPRNELTSAFAISGQILTIAIQQNTVHQINRLGDADILVQPDLGSVGTADFTRVVDAASAGLKGAQEVAGTLSRLSLSEAEFAAHMAARHRPSPAPPVIDDIRVENSSGIGDRAIRERLHIDLGEPLDVSTLRHDIDVLYALDMFDHVGFRIEKGRDDPAQNVLVLKVSDRSTGRNRLRFGLNLETDFENEAIFNLGMSLTRLPVNRMGAEWRNEFTVGQNPGVRLEFWQPLDWKGRYFIAPEVEFVAGTFRLFDSLLDPDSGGNALSEYRRWALGGALGIGRQLGNFGELRTGLRYGKGRIRLQVGTEDVFDRHELLLGEVFVQGRLDTWDDARFPTSGAIAIVDFFAALEELGSDEDVTGLTALGSFVHTFWGNTLLAEFEIGTTFEAEEQVANLYALGGFLRLSGLQPGELLGSHAALFRLRGYRRIAQAGVLSFQIPVYIGASVESGNAWFDSDDISGDSLRWGGSVYLAIDTPIAPLYVAYGYTQNDRHAAYLFLGQVF